MKKSINFLPVFIVLTISQINAQNYEVFSPDKGIKITVSVKDQVAYSVSVDGKEVLSPSMIAMKINDNLELGSKAKVK